MTQKPEYQFYEDLISSEWTVEIFWNLISELFSNKSTVRRSGLQESITLGQTRLPANLDPVSLIKRLRILESNSQTSTFSPTVAMLAGLVWNKLGKMPDA